MISINNLHNNSLQQFHMRKFTLLNLVAFALLTSSAAIAQIDDCKKFSISFNSALETHPLGVFHGGNKIGTIDNFDSTKTKILNICIFKEHSSEIENNTVCYVSEDSIIVYNVWASGKDLPENSTIPGFSSKLSLFWYEIQLIFRSLIE